ncbi:MAG: hypothetical protein R6V85_13210 [Polyangia bacterium]
MSDERGTRLSEETEVLLRQVHPKFFACGRISSQAFEAPPSHAGKLSVDREALTTAREAFELYTDGFGRESAGVCGVTVGEVHGLELEAYENPIEESAEHPADPAHAVIDLSGLSRSKMKSTAGKLAREARERGMIYQP